VTDHALTDADVQRYARAFHDAYERLAPSFGYQTRKASAVPWDDVPADNKALMLATVRAVLEVLVEDGKLLPRPKQIHEEWGVAVPWPGDNIAGLANRALDECRTEREAQQRSKECGSPVIRRHVQEFAEDCWYVGPWEPVPDPQPEQAS
jgi:hypothetical protein